MKSGLSDLGRDLVSLDLVKLHLEDQRRSAGNVSASPCLAVAKGRRDVHLPLVALDHQLHGLRPSLDHLLRLECRRLAALVRRVELYAVNQLPLVVARAW